MRLPAHVDKTRIAERKSILKILENTYSGKNGALHYLEVKNDKPPLLLIHAQGVCARSFENVMGDLAKIYHVYAVDCYGHGGSAHNPALYNLKEQSFGIAEFIRVVAGGRVSLAGHSSGGLIAAYIASAYDVCDRLFLEDPPFFSCEGERRFKAFNYIDLSTICHNFLAQSEEKDFVLYYFINQRTWDMFPPEVKARIYDKTVAIARKDREKHPKGDLKILTWPKNALEGFKGMSDYDPRFGEAFYNDTFNAGVSHEEMLSKITCSTRIMKAQTLLSDDGTLYCAMSDEDAERACSLIKRCSVINFDCGHGIHYEKKREFLSAMTE